MLYSLAGVAEVASISASPPPPGGGAAEAVRVLSIDLESLFRVVIVPLWCRPSREPVRETSDLLVTGFAVTPEKDDGAQGVGFDNLMEPDCTSRVELGRDLRLAGKLAAGSFDAGTFDAVSFDRCSV